MAIDVSVVIPTYKRMGLLYQCLSALDRQDFDPRRMEVIVVTDGPDLDTYWLMEGAMEGGPCFRCYSLTQKKGPAAARNLGWQLAAGKLILFTDDDCLPEPNWVRSYWEAYSRHAGLHAVQDHVAFKGSVIVPFPERRPTDYEKNVARLETAEFVTANCACPRTLLFDIGGFDESFTMAWREDSDLQFKLLERETPVITVAKARVVHPVRKGFWGISLKEQKKSFFDALLYKKHPELFRKRIYAQPVWRYYFMILLFLSSVALLLAGAVTAGIAAGVFWLLLSLDFSRKRLAGTSRSFLHVTEMLVTSMIIPFLSVYWRVYGAVRYKTFFL